MAQSQHAESLGDLMGVLQRQAQESRRQEEAQAQAQAQAREAPSGFFVVPGVRFSDRLWAKLGGKARESDRQGRRERMTAATALPAPRFDVEYRRDNLWKQRELRIRQAYVEHLENLTLEKDDEKEALQRRVMQQVTGVYKQAESEAITRLADRASHLEAKTLRQPAAQATCEAQTAAAVKCYQENPENPLPCWDMVAAFEECARRARRADLS